ncbi:MAG TPA: HEAT repeat domain-containing protein, partial [Pyrinomonadaceae bacterium]|nr:HEAT repeat domain-containing protein [Pyrinomonadaceae bacterium]
MNDKYFRLALCVLTVLLTLFANASAQPTRRSSPLSELPANTQLNIMRHEDERRWDDQLNALLADNNPKVRKRAALAAGRIGDERAVPVLAEMLLTDRDMDVRQMAAFALGEIESAGGAFALVTVLNDPAKPGRARAIEALGKVTAALESRIAATSDEAAKHADDDRLDLCKAAIVNALRFENGRGPQRDRLTVLLGLTAVLRTKPDGVGPLVTKFLDDPDPSIVATALNTMARLRLKDGNERVRQLLSNGDPIVRANAARVIGAGDHKEAFEKVLELALHDSDLRVRVSAIRTLANLKDARAADPLLKRGNSLLDSVRQNPSARNELLEIATTLGRLLTNSMNADAIDFLRDMHTSTRGEAVEVEVAFARIAPGIYLTNPTVDKVLVVGSSWRHISRRAQGLAAFRDVLTGAATGSAGDGVLKDAQKELAGMLQRSTTPTLAIPDVLQAYASYKNPDTDQYARRQLQSRDVIVRATAAEVIGSQKPSEQNTRALIEALPRAMRDKNLNDAALAILNALGKQKTATANDAIKTGLNSSDQQIRRK